MLGRLYFARQAAALLKFAKATSNPELAAVLVQKAANLKAQMESPKRPSEDKSARAPDVEWPTGDPPGQARDRPRAETGAPPRR